MSDNGDFFGSLTDSQFSRVQFIKEMLVLVSEECPNKKQLRHEVFQYDPEIRPAVVYSGIRQAIDRGLIIEVNGTLDITPKGRKYV